MKKIYKGYCKLEVYVVCTGFFAIIILTFGNALLRLFDHPIVSNDDICRLLFSWVAFMGADIALRSNRLVSMNLLTMHLPVKIQKVLQVVVYLIMIAILSMFIVQGIGLARMNWARYFNTLTISYGWATLSLPVCSAQLILTIVIKLVHVLSHFGDDSYSISQHDPDNETKIEKEAE